MGQYARHVFVCTTGSTCPTQGDTEAYVKLMRTEVAKAGLHTEIRVNKSGCFSQCGNGPMIVVYPEDVWYAGVRAEDHFTATTTGTFKIICEVRRGQPTSHEAAGMWGTFIVK